MTPMRIYRLGVVAVLLTVFAPALVEAQVIRRPPRSRGGLFGGADRPVDPNRTSSVIAMDVDLLGGWTDDVIDNERAVAEGTPRTSSGYNGVGSAALRFWRGREVRSFSMNARTHVTQYAGEERLTGADGGVAFRSNIGDRTEVSGSGQVSFLPALTLSAFSSVQDLSTSGVVADRDPSRAAIELQSRGYSGSAGLSHRWSRTQQTAGTVEMHEQRFFGDSGIQSRFRNNRGQSANVTHEWGLTRTTGLTMAYRYWDQRVRREDGGTVPVRTDGGEAGLTMRRQLSRTRALLLSGSGGVDHVGAFDAVNDVPYAYYALSGSGSVRLDLARSWGIAGDFRRRSTMLDGISLSSFITDTVSTTFGGNLTDSFGVAVSGALSSGKSPSRGPGSFSNRIGTVQLDYAIGSWGSVVTSYSYYVHHLRLEDETPLGFPTRLIRNAVRVGMSIQLPLYGNFAGPGGTAN